MSQIAKEVLSRAANRLRQIAQQKSNKSQPLLEWAREYLPHHLTRGFSRFHAALAEEYDRQRVYRSQKVCIIAPRGNAKTTITIIDILKNICEGTEPFMIIVSDAAPQAQGILDTIKMELESNEKIRTDYPMACAKGSVWNKDEIETQNKICIRAFGTGQKVRGIKYRQYRPTKIYVDDPDNDEDVRSATTRLNHQEWFDKALMQCGDTETNFCVVGTMLHRECIVGFLEKRPDFTVVKFQSIMHWPKRMDLWTKWEEIYWSSGTKFTDNGVVPKSTKKADNFYEEHRVEMDEEAEVLWAEKEDLYTLMKMRAGNGHAAFASEKQNDPRDPSKCEFHEEWFEGDDLFYDEEELRKKIATGSRVASVIYGDPAKGKETKRHDYSPIVTLHFFEDGTCWIEIEMEKIPVTIFTDHVLDWASIVDPTVIAFEANGFQELIGDEIVAKAEQRHMFNLNIFPLVNTGAKEFRISRLSVWLRKRFFKFKRSCKATLMLIQQLKDHPHPDHDDGSDALESCLRVLTTVVRGNGETETSDDGIGSSIV